MYYVYAYLREKDSDSGKAGTPYYIGKGKGNRAFNEYHNVVLPTKKDLIVFLETQLTDIGSLALERRLIRLWGRIDQGTGVLRNRTDGGEGSSGRIVTKYSKDKQVATRRANGNYVVTSETRDKLSKSLEGFGAGIKKSESHRINIQSAKVGNKNPMFGKIPTEEHKSKLKEAASKEPKAIVECPHCHKVGGAPSMTRWHFNNCKKRGM